MALRGGTKCVRGALTKGLASAGVGLLLSGCGGNLTPVASSPAAGMALHGSVYGGQQPISGATVGLYAASTAGYGAASASLLKTAVTTDANGLFNITGDYSCSAGQQLYIVAMGGNPGAGTNSSAGQMAALGDCSGLSASTFINMNEVTTVGSVFPLAPFMSGYAAVGTSATNTAGLARAFASVNKLVNIANGSAGGSALPAGATAPTAEIYTLADVLAACINSNGGTAGDGTTCGTLFSLTTVTGGSAPVDTIGAALNMAKSPTQNVAALFSTTGTTSPFASRLTTAPSDWTLAINYTSGGYTGGGFNAPSSTSVDAKGNVWVANAGSNTVTVLAQSGAPVSGSPFTGNGLNGPVGVAIDASGDAWVANKAGSSVSVFTATGGVFAGSPFTGAGLSAPAAIAIDGPGNVWVANSGNSSLSEFSSTGTPVQQVTSGVTAPTAIAISPN